MIRVIGVTICMMITCIGVIGKVYWGYYYFYDDYVYRGNKSIFKIIKFLMISRDIADIMLIIVI